MLILLCNGDGPPFNRLSRFLEDEKLSGTSHPLIVAPTMVSLPPVECDTGIEFCEISDYP